MILSKIKQAGVAISVSDNYEDGKILCIVQLNLGETWHSTNQWLEVKETLEETFGSFLDVSKTLLVDAVSRQLKKE